MAISSFMLDGMHNAAGRMLSGRPWAFGPWSVTLQSDEQTDELLVRVDLRDCGHMYTILRPGVIYRERQTDAVHRRISELFVPLRRTAEQRLDRALFQYIDNSMSEALSYSVRTVEDFFVRRTRQPSTTAVNDAADNPPFDNQWYQPCLAAERQAKQAEANAKSRELLYKALTEQQRITMDRESYFDVPSKLLPDLVYRLKPTFVYGIEVRLFNKRIGSFCVSVKDTQSVPVYDLLLAQKLMLETDERRFVATGNPGSGEAPLTPPTAIPRDPRIDIEARMREW